jgi:hypothetical protein
LFQQQHDEINCQCYQHHAAAIGVIPVQTASRALALQHLLLQQAF